MRQPPATSPKPSMICAALFLASTVVACGGGAQQDDALSTAQAFSVADPAQGQDAPAKEIAVLPVTAPGPSSDDSPAPRDSELVATATVDRAAVQDVVPADQAQSAQQAEQSPPAATAQHAPAAVAASAAAAAPVAIAASDIAAHASTRPSGALQRWGNVQCNGQIFPSQQLPADGLHGSRLPDGRTLRFGLVPDPSSATGAAFEVSLNVNDPLTARSDRCEMSFPASADAGIPRRSVFWHAFAVKLGDWSSTTDEQAIAQWHAGDASGGLLPIYTLLVRGARVRLVLRHDTSSSPSRATTKALEVWAGTTASAGTWMTIVTQALMSHDVRDGPFIKTWLNGEQIVDYGGPVGYDQPAVQPYAKHGIYHWVDQYNAWDANAPTRTLRLKDPVLISDPQRRYEAATVRALVEGN